MNELQDADAMTQDEGGRGASGSTDAVVQTKIKLRGVSKPPVWRRLQVHADTHLDRLHEAIVAALGWQGYHMHVLTSGPDEFGMPDPELGFIDERRVSLGELISGVGDRLRYTYDFGDGWEHEIVVEAVGVAEPGERYPRCVGGEGACPPEDCGGPPGYEHLRVILADPGDEDHDDMVTWLGLDRASEFDPVAFDIEAVNRGLVAVGAPR